MIRMMMPLAGLVYDDILPGFAKDEVVSSVERISGAALSVIDFLPKEPAVLAYSGGIDSGIMASLLSESRNDIEMLTLGRSGSSDLEASAKQRDKLPKASSYAVEKSEIEIAARKVSEIVEVSNLA